MKAIPQSTQKHLRASLPIGAPVTVTGADKPITGKVRALWVDSNGLQYSVRYTSTLGVVCDDWFRPDEVSPAGDLVASMVASPTPAPSPPKPAPPAPGGDA